MAAIRTSFESDQDAAGACLRRLMAGQGEALGELFDRFAPKVFGVAVRVLRNEADAEETVADVFQQVWREAGKFDAARGSVEAWISRLAHSRAIDRLRRRRARPDEHSSLHLDAADDAYSSLSDAAPALLESLQTESAVRAAFGVLGADQQRCVALAFLEGLSHPEIAERLALPLGTVKSHVRRGLLAMRAYLEERGHDRHD